jgi:thioredoxin-like negative regulator of GroEL
VRDLKAALEIDPNNADTLGLLSNCYLISGKVAAARPIIERLLAIDPLTPLNRCLPGFADIMEGSFSTAVEPYRRMFEMDSDNPMARLFYMWVLVLAGRATDAEAIANGFPPDAHDLLPARVAFFLVHALARNVDGLPAALTDDVQAAAAAGDVFARFIAEGYAVAGMPEPAMRWLEIAVGNGFINYPFLAHHDPFLQSLRGQPRFLRLMETVRARWEAFEP